MPRIDQSISEEIRQINIARDDLRSAFRDVIPDWVSEDAINAIERMIDNKIAQSLADRGQGDL